MKESTAILALANGTIFRGKSIGAEGQVNGEIVFNTSMSGYQEILTDPSYAKQIVTPLIHISETPEPILKILNQRRYGVQDSL